MEDPELKYNPAWVFRNDGEIKNGGETKLWNVIFCETENWNVIFSETKRNGKNSETTRKKFCKVVKRNETESLITFHKPWFILILRLERIFLIIKKNCRTD
jgi:hypothetical protein